MKATRNLTRCPRGVLWLLARSGRDHCPADRSIPASPPHRQCQIVLLALFAGMLTIAAPCTLPELPILLGASIGRHPSAARLHCRRLCRVLCSLVSMRHKRRHRHCPQHLTRDAAEDSFLQPRVPVGAHYQHVEALVSGQRQNGGLNLGAGCRQVDHFDR